MLTVATAFHSMVGGTQVSMTCGQWICSFLRQICTDIISQHLHMLNELLRFKEVYFFINGLPHLGYSFILY